MNYNLSEKETELAEIIWDNEPIKSSNIVKICFDRFNWKKSTTYTMIKRVENKGVIINDNGIVRSVISKKDYYATLSKQYLEENFEGSLPKFIAAFTSKERLSKKEIEEIEKMIQSYKEL
ncbi:MAG: BlaI/MecI/CopY family transcriptional regulator [Epulopiscium sp.]|nr:BlaI/MecI/CopY family transcriptional regulator [Candidatus Epulonipiscium sp.]